MNTMRQTQQNGTQVVPGTMPVESQRVGSESQESSDTLILEFLTGLEREGSIQNRLNGYQSESQGQ